MLAPIYVLVKTVPYPRPGSLNGRDRLSYVRLPWNVPAVTSHFFILPAEAKQSHDDETSRWIDTNTRPCPSCSVPIEKIGGCNHMRCCHCHASFCWACMRLGTICAAYGACRNGTPYRNAVPGQSADQRPPRFVCFFHMDHR
jgi:hypothetical protein